MNTRKRKQNKAKAKDSSVKQLRQEPPNTPARNNSKEFVDLTDLLRKNLRPFRVSPLYNFNSGKLKRYEMKIQQELNAGRKFDSRVTFTCTISLNENLRQSHDCPPAIMVEVRSSQSKTIYSGYFISWTKKKQDIQGFTVLPLLLVQTCGHEYHKIHMSICKIFDCDIQPISFSLYATITFFAELLQNPTGSSDISQEYLSLEYQIPCCKPKDRITVTLLLQDTIIILAGIIDSLREENAGIRDEEIIVQFYNRIMHHIYKVYHLDLKAASLHKVFFPDAYITADGQLKLKTNEVAVTVLNVLQHFTTLEDIVCT